MKKRYFYVSIVFFILACSTQGERLKEDITCRQAKKLIQEHIRDTNFVILDVRTEEEYSSGHIEKALFIDYFYDDFQDRIGELDTSKVYLVYCRAGGRSAETIGLMNDLSFNNLYHLYEGMDTWKKKGYKTVSH